VTSPTRLGLLRFWLGERSNALGLILAVVVAPILALAISPRGRGRVAEGIITRFGLTETDTGSYPVAVVRLATTQTSVQLPRENRCKVGGRIQRLERSGALGRSYAAAATPCF
jgi:hypothetical protein